MGLASIGSFLVYGIAVIWMGSIGPVLGFPVYMAMIIVTANFWGLWRGEWRGSDRRTYTYLLSGILIIVTAIYWVSLGQ